MARMALSLAWAAKAAAGSGPAPVPATFGHVPVGGRFLWPSYPATVMTKTAPSRYSDPAGRSWAGHPASVVRRAA